MSEACLPPQWAEATLDEIAEIQGGIQKGKKRSSSLPLRDVPYLRVANVQRGYLDLDVVQSIQATEEEISQLRLQVGDVLFNEGGDRDKLGRGWIWTGALSECIHQNHVFRARIIDRILNSKLLSWYGNTLGQQYFFDEGKQTTNLASLNSSKLKALPVLVPPQAEQHRIVEAIESYLTRLDDAMATLERVQRNLERYRASVLKAAVEGRLVPTEAELARAESREYEPASVLLERILVDRRRRWEEAELAKMQAKGTVPKNDKWKAKYVEPAAPDTSELLELPEGWCWASVDQLAAHEDNSLADGPFGSNLKSSHYTASGPRVIRLQNIGNGKFIDSEAHVSPEHYASLSKHSVAPGDVVIASLGTELPRACVVPDWLGPAIVKADCLRFATHRSLLRPWFAVHALNSTPSRKRAEGLVHGVGRPRIGLTLLRQFPVPLPPLDEQDRILGEVEHLLSLSDAMVLAATHNRKRVAALRQSILKWAFEGRLVDQDPNDEPAALLLERIRAERTVGNGKKQTRPRRVNTRTATA
jgi:type I restriction enzyme S subunit